METVTISKKEYEALKKVAAIDPDLYQQLVQSVEDLNAGKMKRVK